MNDVPARVPEVVGRGGEVLAPSETPAWLSRPERIEQLVELNQAVKLAARQMLTPEMTFDPGNGKQEPQKEGYQVLARAFQIESWSDPPQVTWEPNREFMRLSRVGEPIPNTVAPVPEHCRARVTAHAAAPWGQQVSRTRICSTRGKHFWLLKGGATYNTKKWREEGESTCVGIAETRAINAAVDAVLALGKDPTSASDEDLERQRKRKQEKTEQVSKSQLQQQWVGLLSKHAISEEAEDAFYRSATKLPNRQEDFGAQDYRRALELFHRRGREIFDKAMSWVRSQEERSGTACPDCNATVPREAKACLECGRLVDGPPPPEAEPAEGDEAPEPPQEAEAPEEAPEPEAEAEEAEPPPPEPEPEREPPRHPAEYRNELMNELYALAQQKHPDDAGGWVRSHAQVLLAEEQLDDYGLQHLEIPHLEKLLEELTDTGDEDE